MRLSQRLWNASADLAKACRQHPFVRELASGALPRPRFQFYIGQDAFFLRAFLRGYAVAAARARDDADTAAFLDLAAAVRQEMDLHRAYARKWQVDMSRVQPALATRAYTDFLLATAWGQGPGAAAAAMAPCLRLYAWLGRELARGGVPRHDYADWIRTYSSPGFEAAATRLEGIVDRLSGPEEAGPVYRHAMRCELLFFETAWQSGGRPSPDRS
jgi:thiaminase/transcriptional activator TenA